MLMADSSLTIGADPVSTGQGRLVVARRGASLPRKKDAHYNCQPAVRFSSLNRQLSRRLTPDGAAAEKHRAGSKGLTGSGGMRKLSVMTK